MSNKFFVLAMTGLVTASGSAVFSALSIVSTPVTPSANAQQVQRQNLEPKLRFCKTATETNCIPRKPVLIQSGYPIDPQTGAPSIQQELPKEFPKPEPRPGNGGIPSNIR